MTFERFSCLFDLHGDEQDATTVNLFHRHCREWKPKHRIIGGDLFDMKCLRGKASAEEKNASLKADFDAGMEFFDAFRPTHYLVGNHERRLWDGLLSLSAPVRDLAGHLTSVVNREAERFGCRILPYGKRTGVLAIGSLRFLHGFFAGSTACRKHAEIYGPCVFGHIHAYDHVSLPSYDGNREAWSSPAACVLDMQYNDGTPSTLRYRNGWVYGVVSERQYHVEVAVVENGKAVVASGLKVLG